MGFLSSIGKVLGGVAGIALGGTTGGALLGIGGNLLSGLMENRAQSKAASTADAASQESNYLMARMYDTAREDDAPYREAAKNALARMQEQRTNETPFSYSQLWADPSYAFRTQEGLRGVNQSAAAGGLLQSGATLKALNDYAQNAASQEYDAAYKRYADQQDRTWNQDAQLAGMGQQLNNNLSSVGATTAGKQAQNIMAAAGVRGASYINSASNMASVLKGVFS